MKTIRLSFNVGILNEARVLISTEEDKDWKAFIKFYGIKVPKGAILIAFEHKGRPHVWVDQSVNINMLDFDPYKIEFRMGAKKMLAKHNDYYANYDNTDKFYYQAKKIIVDNLHSSFEEKFYKYNFNNEKFDLIREE